MRSRFFCVFSCEQCGEQYAIPKCRTERRQTKFCRRSCKDRAEKPKSRVDLVCRECGANYTRVKSSAHNSLFCSITCKNINYGRSVRTTTYDKVIQQRALVLLDDGDENFRRRIWFNQLGRPQVNTNGKREQLARAILMASGLTVDGKIVDHINRNFLDNRKTNLRICNASQNSCNKIQNRTPAQGLVKYSSSYAVRVAFQYQVYSLPAISDEQKARAFRDYIAKQKQGEFCVEIGSSYEISEQDVEWIRSNIRVSVDRRSLA